MVKKPSASHLKTEEPMGRAFLVIDEQNECFTGNLPITHPAGHLDRTLRVMDEAEGKIPTIVVHHHFPQLDKLD